MRFDNMDGFSVMASVFPFLFFIVFGIILIVFVVTFVRGIGEWHKNNNSPRLTVPAKVVSKRTSVSHGHHHSASGHMHTTGSTWYYATFEVESGDRMELALSGSEYGMLAEGDTGKLTFQGTRYLSFERE